MKKMLFIMSVMVLAIMACNMPWGDSPETTSEKTWNIDGGSDPEWSVASRVCETLVEPFHPGGICIYIEPREEAQGGNLRFTGTAWLILGPDYGNDPIKDLFSEILIKGLLKDGRQFDWVVPPNGGWDFVIEGVEPDDYVRIDEAEVPGWVCQGYSEFAWGCEYVGQ